MEDITSLDPICQTLKCIRCDHILTGRQTLFCSRTCKMLFHSKNPNNYIKQQERAYERKIILVNEKGGECHQCGYSKNLAALCFHHLNPIDKSFGVDARRISNTSLKVLRSEIAKCILLCHNCHMETHYPELNLVRPEGFEPPTQEL